MTPLRPTRRPWRFLACARDSLVLWIRSRAARGTERRLSTGGLAGLCQELLGACQLRLGVGVIHRRRPLGDDALQRVDRLSQQRHRLSRTARIEVLLGFSELPLRLLHSRGRAHPRAFPRAGVWPRRAGGGVARDGGLCRS